MIIKQQQLKTIKQTRQFSNELMDKLRQTGDPLADEVIIKLHETEGIIGVRSMFSWLNSSESTSSYQIINEFIAQNNVLPDFANKRIWPAPLPQHPEFRYERDADIADERP